MQGRAWIWGIFYAKKTFVVVLFHDATEFLFADSMQLPFFCERRHKVFDAHGLCINSRYTFDMKEARKLITEGFTPNKKRA